MACESHALKHRATLGILGYDPRTRLGKYKRRACPAMGHALRSKAAELRGCYMH
jgi:hypothetical protein